VKKVYIVHPLRGDVQTNEHHIAQLCRNIADTARGIVPISPVLSFSFFDPTTEPVKAMQFCLELLACCEEVWVYGDWWKSEGCQAEICFAGCRGKRISFKDGFLGMGIPPNTAVMHHQ
jgi:hypothetical protein